MMQKYVFQIMFCFDFLIIFGFIFAVLTDQSQVSQRRRSRVEETLQFR